ncbi:TIGR02117 family protein [Litoribacter ruber]|uniref:TIGR02117 family protein n=1 Tax=Litoribacter ruber TaxID=702568 RepID=UPI001BD946EE|nr:TIGR02117 family protein [Litoribacter ruber]MBT0811706.1 TIGR02117 family protein [Litoribacter ruber]
MKKLLRLLLIPVLFLIGLGTVYMLSALLGMLIPVGPERESFPEEVEIFVHTNGLHADFVLPTTHHLHDWKEVLEGKHFGQHETPYLSIGWGEKNFYLNTPTMADLTATTLLNALFVPSTSAMHVDYMYGKPREGENARRISISEDMYLELVDYILDSFELENGRAVLIDHEGYYDYDQFYRAKGKYHALWTCNNWTNRGLKKIGIKNSLWTPMDWGVFYYLEEE